MVAIHQFVPSLAPRDAIGGHARHIQRTLRDAGFESTMFVGEAREVGPGEVEDYRSFDGGRGPTWLLYQLSTGSKMAGYLMGRTEPRIVDYHNVTPPSFFTVWEAAVAGELSDGRAQMAEMAAGTVLGLADSGFNRAELDDAGYGRTAVLPILLDLTQFDVEVDERRLDELLAARRLGGADLLFVGRVAPHKSQHDLIKALAAYRRLYDPQARLHLVGGSSSHAYWTTLHRYAEYLELGDAVQLHGSVTPGELAAHYRAADAFVCLSEHEGFCVPLLEAWHHRLPVVAFAAAAVPETVAGGGLVLPAKDSVTVAAALHRVLSDPPLRDRMVTAGLARLGDFELERTRKILVAAIEELVAGAER